MKTQKVYAFIDSQNLNLGVISQGWKVDFARLRVYLKDKYQVEQAFLFIGYVKGNESLYTTLQRAGYTVVFKPTLEYRKEGETVVKGNVDAELVLHSMIEFPNYDKAVVVTGDGDFHCLIEYLMKKKKLGKVLIPNRKKYSRLLEEFHPKLAFVDNLRDKVGELKREASPRHRSLRLSSRRDKRNIANKRRKSR